MENALCFVALIRIKIFLAGKIFETGLGNRLLTYYFFDEGPTKSNAL